MLLLLYSIFSVYFHSCITTRVFLTQPERQFRSFTIIQKKRIAMFIHNGWKYHKNSSCIFKLVFKLHCLCYALLNERIIMQLDIQQRNVCSGYLVYIIWYCSQGYIVKFSGILRCVINIKFSK